MFRIDYKGTAPYINCLPSLYHHKLGPKDRFLILSSDGLYQYFTNKEAVSEVELFIQLQPEGDPAQHLVEEVLFRAAKKAGINQNPLWSESLGILKSNSHKNLMVPNICIFIYFLVNCRNGLSRVTWNTSRGSKAIPWWCFHHSNIFGRKNMEIICVSRETHWLKKKKVQRQPLKSRAGNSLFCSSFSLATFIT